MIKKNSGFTLVDMTMATAVVALLAIGITVGKDLLETSKLNAVASKLNSMETARIAFIQKYDCMPGDCPAINDYGFSFYGDGNGKVTDNSGGTDFEGEIAAYWQHLKTAGLINMNIEEYGIPNLEHKGAHVSIGYQSSKRKNYYILGVDPEASGATNQTIAQFLLPSEMLHIDLKIDDGIPQDGNMMGVYEPDIATLFSSSSSSSGGGGSSSSGSSSGLGGVGIQQAAQQMQQGLGGQQSSGGFGAVMDMGDFGHGSSSGAQQPTNHCYDSGSPTYQIDQSVESCAGRYAFANSY